MIPDNAKMGGIEGVGGDFSSECATRQSFRVSAKITPPIPPIPPKPTIGNSEGLHGQQPRPDGVAAVAERYRDEHGSGRCASVAPEIPSADRWGPFAADIDEPERRARLRSMRAIVHLCAGPRGDALARELRLAERDAARLTDALAELSRLAALDRRHVLASFARLYRAT